MQETLWEDLLFSKVIRARKGLLWKHVIWGLLLKPSFACVFWYRVNRWIYLHRFPNIIVTTLSVWRFYRFANDISYCAEIGAGFMVGHVHGIVIGGNAKIGKRCLVRHGVTIGAANNECRAMPLLGDDIEIGAQTVVIGNISIGDRSKLGTMSLITSDIDPDTLAYGIPPNLTKRKLATS